MHSSLDTKQVNDAIIATSNILCEIDYCFLHIKTQNSDHKAKKKQAVRDKSEYVRSTALKIVNILDKLPQKPPLSYQGLNTF